MVNEKRSTLVSRRRALAGVAALGFGLRGSTARADVPGLKIGVPDWTLKHSADIGTVALARKIGFEGVEVSVNRAPSKSERVEAFDDALCQRYIAESKKQGVAIASTRINGFSRNLDPETAVKFLVEGSRATQRLGVHVMLVPCFGLKTEQELDRMGDILRQAAPEVEKAGAILGLEDSNTARENVRMIERSRSSAVKVFYDIGNTTRYGLRHLRGDPLAGYRPDLPVSFEGLPGNASWRRKGEFPQVLHHDCRDGLPGLGRRRNAQPKFGGAGSAARP